MREKNKNSTIKSILGLSFLSAAVLGIVAGIFNWEVLGIICAIVMVIVVISVILLSVLNI